MNTEDYVSYPVALALKNAGFDEPCDHCYAKTSDSECELIGMTTSRDYNKPRDGEPPFLSPICSAVPLWHAQKWLREKKGIFVEVTSEALYDWDFHVLELGEDVNAGLARGSDIYPSYEAALSTGISVVLELIKKGG